MPGWWRERPDSAQHVAQRDAAEHEHAGPVVVEKGVKAGLAPALTDQPLLVDEGERAEHETPGVWRAQARVAPDQPEVEEHRRLQQADDQPVLLAEHD